MNSSTTRRTFLKQVTLGGATLMFAPSFLKATSNHTFASETMQLPGILPVAVVEDCFDIAFAFPGMSNRTKIALAGDVNLKIPGNKGRLSQGLALKKDALLDVLEKIKKAPGNAASKDTHPIYHDKLSFLLGILSNNVLHQHLQPVYQKYPQEVEELSIYQDTYLLRTLADAGVAQVRQEDLNKLLNVLLPRATTRVHTLIPDSPNGADWVVNMGRWRKKNQALMGKYARIYTHPDAGKVKKYVKDINFYNADDAIIKLCRKIQNSEKTVEDAFKNGIDTAINGGSQYAQILALAVNNIRFVDEFLQGGLDGQKLLSKLKMSLD